MNSLKTTPKQAKQNAKQALARKRGNAGNHPKYSQQDRLAAINNLIDGE